MREIIFRAKKEEDGRWVYGNLIQSKLAATEIMEYQAEMSAIDFEGNKQYTEFRTLHKVEEDTIGMYIGREDCHGRRIYEGDIIYTDERGMRYVVVYDTNTMTFIAEGTHETETMDTLMCTGTIEVVGNIHDAGEQK